jgi:hypothetical protein
MLKMVFFSVLGLCIGCGPGPSQQSSAACNPKLGIDACGAGLFCAAFDGRMTPTCYALGSRKAFEACESSNHCASGGCIFDGLVGVCQGRLGEACNTRVGCAGGQLKCVELTCVP